MKNPRNRFKTTCALLTACEINFLSVTPIHLQLAEQLKQTIKDQKALLDKRLPSLWQVKSTLSVSISTALKAYTVLNQAGLIYWVKGDGFFVV